ncbi:Helix-turn-helix domain-containing protein [Candidatus Pantoea symbiotica]|jgi:transcriptional regulator with XRE-family HTH domain|uniref:Helix-turn-helix domain-containing protein n=1 Tax=Candidatus Pantoea symbiotica TaxID=1884370 RepID=A0A1I3XLI4_9GAMM|nr:MULTISPECIES: helix-turn-helix transcriptional regulator [Pantoea]KAJ9434347.1 helix-turn-helix transcriptional regulator [Pantoea sp. YR343]SFK19896.1 Helix-turn-helix domain-containing protein [Pantoea symbiotica]SFU80298.1 Helix-turn-helix domain-containing protein [Pantoea sp. YR525]
MKKDLRMMFGIQVKKLRVASGQSQEAFADRCGFARSYMSRIERGSSNVSLDAIQTLAEALKVSVRDLFLFDEANNPNPEMFVPYASDGSCFHPGLASPRDGSFRVGERSSQLRFQSFEEALNYLRGMETAKWRRPNSQGNWGLVSAVRWGKLNDQ